MIPTLSREQFYTEYRDTVLAYISARVSSYEDAQDLCQEVFIKFFRALERFDGSRASVSPLMYKITHDIVVDHHRTFHTYTSLDEIGESVPSTEDIYVENEKIYIAEGFPERIAGTAKGYIDHAVLCGSVSFGVRRKNRSVLPHDS